VAFKLSSEVVAGVVRLKPDWLRPSRRRRDVTEALLTTIAGYAAEKRALGLEDGKGTALLVSGSIEREFRDTMRKALGLYDALIGRLTVELRDWVLKARGRVREYPWGNLTAEGEWLWVIPKALPLDSWATPRDEKPKVVSLLKPTIEIQIKGLAGSGKSTFADEIARALRLHGFDVDVHDIDGPMDAQTRATRMAGLHEHMKRSGSKIDIHVIQRPRVNKSLLDWGPDGLYDATRATHLTGCHAASRNSDGDCMWRECPQLKDGEPAKTGRHCPLDKHEDEES
jgi:hypothetical protein